VQKSYIKWIVDSSVGWYITSCSEVPDLLICPPLYIHQAYNLSPFHFCTYIMQTGHRIWVFHPLRGELHDFSSMYNKGYMIFHPFTGRVTFFHPSTWEFCCCSRTSKGCVMSGNQQPQASYVVHNWFSKGKDRTPLDNWTTVITHNMTLCAPTISLWVSRNLRPL
jgi:hypothetical protein